MEPLEAFRYDSEAPASYRCADCGAHRCKLWRQANTFTEHLRLRCVDCACATREIDPATVREDGTRLWKGMSVDTLDWLVPAVPTEDGSTFWGYTSVPEPGVQWWRRLPLRGPR